MGRLLRSDPPSRGGVARQQQQAVTLAVGELTGTLVAGAVLGAYATRVSRSAQRPPRLVVVLGGFFVLTVGSLAMRGATALVGGHPITGGQNLVDSALQMPTVAPGIGIGSHRGSALDAPLTGVRPSQLADGVHALPCLGLTLSG